MSITVILNAYKRWEYLEEQVLAIRNQTKEPVEIWAWVNQTEETKNLRITGLDKVFYSDTNCKYHARFAVGLLANTEYVAYFDDDTIPGNKWFENCLECMDKKPGIYGGAGVIMTSEDYTYHERVGWPSKNKEIKQVDLVGHAWFLRREDLNHLWREVPMSFDNCEDLQLSYLAQKYGSIDTYCPPHPEEDIEMHSSLKAWEYGNDTKASSNGSLLPVKDFYSERNRCIKIALDDGWKTVNKIT